MRPSQPFESPLPASHNRTNEGLSIDCTNQAAANAMKPPKPLFIGVTGGTASGKTSLCNRIAEAFDDKIALVSLDMFYKGLTDDQHEDAANYNFDHPSALDFDLAYEKLNELISGKNCEIPTYDFALHKRTKETKTICTAPIIVFEGIHAIVESRFREMMDLKIFVLTPDDLRLARRIGRDISDRGRTVVDVLAQYNRFVKPAYDDFIRPTMKHADVIIPFDTHNEKAVEMLIENLKIKMRIIERQLEDFAKGLGYNRKMSITDMMTPLRSEESSQSRSSEGGYDGSVILPSEKVQGKAKDLMLLLKQLQTDGDMDSQGNQATQIKLTLKALARKLLKHEKSVSPGNRSSKLRSKGANHTFEPELQSISLQGEDRNSVLSFVVPNKVSLEIQNASTQHAKKLVALLKQNEAGIDFEFEASTNELAKSIFQKMAAKGI